MEHDGRPGQSGPHIHSQTELSARSALVGNCVLMCCCVCERSKRRRILRLRDELQLETRKESDQISFPSQLPICIPCSAAHGRHSSSLLPTRANAFNCCKRGTARHCGCGH